MTHAAAQEPPPRHMRRVFLSTLPARRGARHLAGMVVVTSAVIFVAIGPFARQPLAQVWGFIPMYQAALMITDVITAVLLFGQFGILRWRALLVLACGYLFTALMTISHTLTFPGLFSPTGLLGAGPQTTAWLYMFWHGGFPLLIIGYGLLRTPRREMSLPRRPAAVEVVSGIALVLLAAGGFTFLATAAQDSLPAIMQGNHYTPAMSLVVSSVWALSLLALVVLWRRRSRSVLDLWLMVVMCAWLFDIALSAVLNAGRFDLGFYAGRLYGLLAASAVLVMLLLENGVLYARLARAHDREHRERRLVQRAEAAATAANRAKSEFLSRMSHELRTPLNGIIGFAQLLELDRLTSEQRESVEHILKGGRHLLGLINEVLDIARIDAGRLSVSVEPVMASEALAAALDLVRPQAASRHVDLPLSVASDWCVMADRQRLQQVLLNLLSNAVKYNQEGGVVGAAIEAAASDRVRLVVTDTGDGIPPEMMARLFTPFDRLGAEQSAVDGTGLGLALSKRLVEAMGGTLQAESVVGRGTTFTVELPCAPRPAFMVAPRAPILEPEVARARGTILYIEDNLANLRLLERILRLRPGVTLMSAMQGRQGVDLARVHHPDLVLLDLHLPDLPGEEVLRLLREEPRTRGIPVLILSADASPGQIRRLLDQGASAYLTKPLDVRQLLERLDERLVAPSI
jgi:two-component system, sensor histidine kinase and response regulator